MGNAAIRLLQFLAEVLSVFFGRAGNLAELEASDESMEEIFELHSLRILAAAICN